MLPLPNLLAFALVFCGALIPRAAENRGSEVIVVFNSAVPESREIAQHYATVRGVPASQVIGLDLPTGETISRADFTDKLQKPLREELRRQKLWTLGSVSSDSNRPNVTDATVRYAVLCYGVPLKILADPSVQEEISARLQPQLQRNEASVDSELAALPGLDLKLPITGILINPSYGATNVAQMHPTNGVLMVARLDAPTAPTAKALVDKAVAAELNGLWGRAYIDARGLTNGPHLMGDEWMNESVAAARQYGLDVQHDKAARTFTAGTPLPDIAIYFGWYEQDVSGPFANSLSEFAPGAIAYHLHSYSARSLKTTSQWWAGALLEKGAAVTMGCTEEPYLQFTPDVNMLIRRLLFLGWSFGEAAYAAQRTLSWQITVIGDPLYQPFAKTQSQRHADLLAKNDPNLVWSHLMWVGHRLAAGASLDEIETYFKQTPEAQTSALLQEKLAEIYKSRAKLSSAIAPYQRALALPATPLQNLRITLGAAALFSSWGRDNEAYAAYKSVLEKYPDYPGKKDLYERLAKVALRLKKTDEAAEYTRLAAGS